MPFTRRRKPKAPMELPPVTAASGDPDMRIEGRRLGTLGMYWLKVTCACGHEGKIAVPDLAGRYGGETRVRDAIARMRCSRCGQARICTVTLSSPQG